MLPATIGSNDSRKLTTQTNHTLNHSDGNINKNSRVIKLLIFRTSMLPPSLSAQDYIHCITFPQQPLRRTSKPIRIHYLHNHQLDTPHITSIFLPPMARVYTLTPPQSRHQKNYMKQAPTKDLQVLCATV